MSYGFAGGAVGVFGPSGPQVISPDGTQAAGGWTDQAGGSSNLHTPLADENGTTYVQSPVTPTAANILKLSLSDFTDPGTGAITFDIDAEQI